MPDKTTAYLKPAEATQKTLSFCAARERDLTDWVGQLPMVNLAETGRRLYGALRELNQLKVSPQDRLTFLNILAPSVAYAADGLFRRHLDSLYNLDETERKVAGLAQALHVELATGYKTVALEAGSGWALSRKDTVARALHHCTWALLPNLKRALSLYLPAPAGLWGELHQLYRVARKAETARTEFQWQDHANTLEQGYFAALLLSTAQTFQLQKHELEPLFRAYTTWSRYLKLARAPGGVYLVDPTRDQPPHYITEHTTLLPDSLCLDTRALVQALNEKRAQLPPVHGLTDRLADHLALAWDRAHPRRFRRQTADGRIGVTVGLSAVHKLLSGGQPFESYIRRYRSAAAELASEKRFEARATRTELATRDVWEGSFDAGLNTIASIQVDARKPEEDFVDVSPVTEYGAQLRNMSPRGYCLQWMGETPSNLVTGELVAVRDERSKHRTVGLIRWVRKAPREGLLLGIELLAPNAQACATRVLNKTGQHSDFLRAIVLPEIKTIAQPESVIIPRLAVKVGQKAQLFRQGKEQAYRLTQKVTETSAIGQFSISPVQSQLDKPTEQKTNAWADDPLWRSF
ncbi:MAG: hypothetical protein JXQ97_10590 [Natronospirillum sp.]